METEKRVETLEDEFKLLKGELKETLASVRDYLVRSELPASEFATIMHALGSGGGGGGGGTIEMKFPSKKDLARALEEKEDELVEEEEEVLEPESELSSEEDGQLPRQAAHGQDVPLAEVESPGQDEQLLEDEYAGQDVPLAEVESPGQDELSPDEELVDEDRPFMSGSEMSPEEEPMARADIAEEMSQSTPKVNLLASLIRWASTAKREIGSEQLAVFLEVYGISGHLSPELKEVILHLADVTSEQPDGASTAETWSRLISELHGILTGGDAPRHLVRPCWNDGGGEIPQSVIEAEVEEKKPKDKSLKIKLVFSDGEGREKEFCIDLDQNGSNENS